MCCAFTLQIAESVTYVLTFILPIPFDTQQKILHHLEWVSIFRFNRFRKIQMCVGALFYDIRLFRAHSKKKAEKKHDCFAFILDELSLLWHNKAWRKQFYFINMFSDFQSVSVREFCVSLWLQSQATVLNLLKRQKLWEYLIFGAWILQSLKCNMDKNCSFSVKPLLNLRFFFEVLHMANAFMNHDYLVDDKISNKIYF